MRKIPAIKCILMPSLYQLFVIIIFV